MRHYSESPLLTDIYELTMLQAYFRRGMNGTAAFEFFVRSLPEKRNFLMAAGLEQVQSYLLNLSFDEDDLAWLRADGRFDAGFIESLRGLRFTGDLDAMPEGTAFFPDEPILRVTAPLREAQLVESRVMNLLHYQTSIASKAVRSVIAAGGKRLADFGLRRAHGAEASLLSARASYIAGFDATATTMAGVKFGIPVSGTMTHSFVQAHEREIDAFSDFAHTFPDNVTLLIDTYDTEAAARKVVRLAKKLKEEEIRIAAVRIDSGDLYDMARRVRRILDEGGCPDIGIFVSGNLDEYAVDALVTAKAPIDGFGIGTRMNTSSDAPYLDCAYKLVEYAGRATCKCSIGKKTWPGCKQVFRRHDANGVVIRDILSVKDDTLTGEALLQPVIRKGLLAASSPALSEIRAYARMQTNALPSRLRSLNSVEHDVPEISDRLQNLAIWTNERQSAEIANNAARSGLRTGQIG